MVKGFCCKQWKNSQHWKILLLNIPFIARKKLIHICILSLGLLKRNKCQHLMKFLCLQSCCGKRTLPLLVEFIDIQDYMLLLECTPWKRRRMARKMWKCEHVGKKYLISKIIFEYIFIQINYHKSHNEVTHSSRWQLRSRYKSWL